MNNQNKLRNSSFYKLINKNETFRNELKVEEVVYTENQKTLERKKELLKKGISEWKDICIHEL